MRCSRTEAPSLRRHYPASAVLWTSPPPCRPGLTLAGCRLARATPPDRASRVASILLFHACCRHYPGGTCRCMCHSLPDRWQPSPFSWRVGFRVERFGACSAFAHAAVAVGKAGYPAPPAQIPACPVGARGSYLGCFTAKRTDGQGCRTWTSGQYNAARRTISAIVVRSFCDRLRRTFTQIHESRLTNPLAADMLVGTAK